MENCPETAACRASCGESAMRILFISHTMPGVFGPLAEYFASQSGNDVVFAAEYSRRSLELPGVRRLRVRKMRERRPLPGGRREDAARELQRAFLRGEAMHESLRRLREDGFDPDIIVTSSGMGVSMMTREVFPRHFLAAYLEWFFLPQTPCDDDAPYQRAVQLLTQSKLVVDADYLFTLSQGQRQQYPPFIADHIDILPPCVDTNFFSRAAARPFRHEGRTYSREDEVLVFSIRTAEFPRSAPLWAAMHMLLMQRPQAHVFLLCGGRHVREALAPGWEALPECSRVRLHLLDFIDDASYRDLLCAASLVAMPEPPTLFFSGMLEAMSCGAALVLAAGRALREVASHGECCFLCEEGGLEDITAAVLGLLEQPERLRALQEKGRELVEESHCRQRHLPVQAELLLNAWRRWRDR